AGEAKRVAVAVGTHSNPGTGSSDPPRRSVLPPTNDREQLALDAVEKALRLHPEVTADLRARRGIGADAMDDLRQFYEIKMATGDMPDDVTLTPQEVEAARG